MKHALFMMGLSFILFTTDAYAAVAGGSGASPLLVENPIGAVEAAANELGVKGGLSTRRGR